ncbi:transcription factor GTE7-like [Olea europaea subsp. europaea]|uniref:Transcription factor GTE7-like n=1 Tax=Olea europaea subsp. europaea TaxID=158383 RepID=A0A8S0PIX8_OLEEU|nr:transcription factor GTE7-like [Olea europaea subsp. europaea]
MASALFASQNESSWVHMGKKTPSSSSRLNTNPNPNSNPKKKQKQKQFHHVATNEGAAGRYNDDSPVVTQTASDDACSFNQTSTSRSGFNHGEYLTYSVSSYTKSELLKLRRRLVAELEQIREFRAQIDSGQFNINNHPRSRGKSKKLQGNKRSVASFVSNKDPKRQSGGLDSGNFGLDALINYQDMLKQCKQILTKLMKHKNGWIFNKPVDAAALGLLDYHQIVKQPMDLGTVKSILAKDLYPSPVEFAADVRLTFNNALLYNPKTDQVHSMAEQLLARFEELFRPIQEKIDCYNMPSREREFQAFRVNDEVQHSVNEELLGSSWDNNNQIIALPGLGMEKRSKPGVSPVPVPQMAKKSEKAPMHAHSSSSTPSYHSPLPMDQPMLEETPSPVRAPPPVREHKVVRGSTVKQPKPRAKDPNKRDMSMEEKHKLGLGLQSLPQEKMPQLVQIIRKRNEHLAQDGDEIELDIEVLDTETLWELDRFVTNWKKMVSKTKRQALMINNNLPAAPTSPIAEADKSEMGEANDLEDKPKRNEDEDVDIDDDMPATNFPPVEIEKDDGGGGGGHDHGNASSSSSSSSSGSSSSSDSDTGSSSGGGSDADDAQS